MGNISSRNFSYQSIKEILDSVPAGEYNEQITYLIEDYCRIDNVRILETARDTFVNSLRRLSEEGYIHESYLEQYLLTISDCFRGHELVKNDPKYLRDTGIYLVTDVLNSFQAIQDKNEYSVTRSMLSKYPLSLIIETKKLCEDFLTRYTKTTITKWQMDEAVKTYREKKYAGLSDEVCLEAAFKEMEIIFELGYLGNEHRAEVKKIIVQRGSKSV